MTEDEERAALIYGAEQPGDPDADPDPGVTETAAQAVSALRARVRRLERKAAAANRAREHVERRLSRSFAAHHADVAEAFSRVLAAELEGTALPTSAMPDIGGLVVDEDRGAMYFDPDSAAIRAWVTERHPARAL